jgi:hypothetical protein
MLHCFVGVSLFPLPIVAGAVRILVLRALKISHESVVVCSCDYKFRSIR